MDHHCPWIGRCVDFYNYKYFISMIFYASVALWFMAITYTTIVTKSIEDDNISNLKVYIILVAYFLKLSLGFILTAFFFFHLWLIINGKTTLEFCEKKKADAFNIGCF
mmetsp:Transcript_37698/g.33712  ORF Transcript_37698/g.33712 Transcript_37698/m.33712 type:complete len:108 (+) Transcript_37698:178-501(+)